MLWRVYYSAADRETAIVEVLEAFKRSTGQKPTMVLRHPACPVDPGGARLRPSGEASLAPPEGAIYLVQ